jgi:hypothetical protein
MDRQYEYVFVGDSNHYGFLSYCPGECIDQVAEERMILIADCRLQIEKSEIGRVGV